MSYYKAQFSVIRKTAKYPLYMKHFENLPIFDVDFDWKKESDEVCSFFITSDTIDAFNDALEWIESTTGLEPHKTQWVEEK